MRVVSLVVPLLLPHISPLAFSMRSQLIPLRPSFVTVKANKRDLDVATHQRCEEHNA